MTKTKTKPEKRPKPAKASRHIPGLEGKVKRPPLKLGDFWETPPKVFERLNARFNFTVDAAANERNHKCDLYWDEAADGLKQNWQGHTVFLNPPYSQIDLWLEKAYNESRGNCTVVVLMNVAADAGYWHKWVCNENKLVCDELRFVRGRIKFIPSPEIIAERAKKGKSKDAPRFASAIVIYYPHHEVTGKQ